MSTILTEESSNQGKDLQSGQPQASPHPHQRWVKIVTTVTTLRFWVWAVIIRQLSSTLEED